MQVCGGNAAETRVAVHSVAQASPAVAVKFSVRSTCCSAVAVALLARLCCTHHAAPPRGHAQYET